VPLKPDDEACRNLQEGNILTANSNIKMPQAFAIFK